MNLNFFLTPFSSVINLFIVTFFLLAKKASCTDPQFLACNPESCGDGQNISFPFHIQGVQPDYCGYPGFTIYCNDKGKPVFNLSTSEYIIHEIHYQNQSLRVSNAAVSGKSPSCTPQIQNISLDDGRFHRSSNSKGLFLLYNCNSTLLSNKSALSNYKVDCPGENETVWTLAMLEDDPLLGSTLDKCGTRVLAPVDVYRGENVGTERMLLLEEGFVLNWTASNCSTCHDSGGKCGFDAATYHFKCFCPDRPHSKRCYSEKDKLGLKLGLGIGCLLMGIILLSYIYLRRFKKRRDSSNLLSMNSSSDPSSKADLEGDGVYLSIPIFSYTELGQATNNFDSEKELGDGGFGTVYYGKLKDGREVAVKRLYEHNYKRVKQFMNEIEILTRLHHKNLVCLYGCSSRRSRELLLVYEYIPNGTVADHLHGDQAKSSPLTWPIRMSIAIETASALAYLHASDIIHRDVKTNNILLDNNFSVKVADFGLSRLFPKDVTHVSTVPQGTPGYVDPEYHQSYQLTDKSDVYSFGVVLIELISSMPAVDITRHRHEINLSNLAISKIQKCAFDELIDSRLGYNSDEEVKRMTTSVAELAFQCLQQDKEIRPSMENVLQQLKTIQGGESMENLSNLAISKIQKCAVDELIDSRLGYNSDEEVKRTTTSVAELAFQCLQQDKETRLSMENVLQQLKTIQGGQSLENLEEVHDDNKRSKNTLPPPSPPYCDEAGLLKNIRLPPSPVSVTAKWASSGSTTPNESV
ncbi:LEAF RUST 10 DISEASE-RESISTANCEUS RECEPTOR-LIKE PROTEIN KINASE-like 1.2 isoform X4 [Populus alba]|uniref:LEAF RUST 10 DISEASE-RESISTANCEUS RECEPTOR-LIKE PROTEIN KINASE-like 1.2 isoform X4 n=1 Tax=Populus alba TaxID=43335 RepID=UPI00158C8CDE|nr:LEAF RUST 10 DISEASE-RESISTANCE LOCUS RECEPTOR-LIKE PROTEIN KINASE-like 1.2 isoform X2 [Populus alba]